tara:strand:+ start:1237 stop:2598 length:1362 start_codon:yes stop_codon:yes gene_type:complete
MESRINNLVDWVSKRILPALILFSALSVSGSAAFYSVSGLSKLFAGAALEVMIMAGSLEVAKLVTATLLHRYWKELSFLLKSYLTIAVIILVAITSMGIYGFLSSAYQETFNKLMQRDNKIAFLQEKADFYQSDVTRYEKELEQISNNISTLSNAKATSIQVRDTTVAGGVRQTVSTAELRLSQSRIESEEINRGGIREKRDRVADSLQRYQLNILQLKSDTDVAGELGPLEYLSNLTGVPMDSIINILLLVIVFVFDPLAISLVLAANFAFARISNKDNKKQVPKLPNVEDEQQDFLDNYDDYDDLMYPERDFDPSQYEEYDRAPMSSIPGDLVEKVTRKSEEIDEALNRIYEIYGETGSIDPRDIEVDYDEIEAVDWEIEAEDHSDFEDAEKNIILEEGNPNKRLKDLQRYLEKERIGGINPRLKKDILNEISTIKKQIQDNESDDLTKIY